jgi:predicted O-methyltransferase YrrM
VKEHGGIVYAVDWFAGNVGEPFKGEHAQQVHYFDDNPERVEQTYNNFLHNIKEIDCENIVKVLKGPSSEKIPEIPDGCLDICFIDAEHSYENVKEDILLCIPKLKDDGILCGHDWNQSGVQKAVTEVLKGCHQVASRNGKRYYPQCWERTL